MKFLKGLGTFVCSFLLFLALTIFSLVFMLHSTVLSPGFITNEVNRVELASILDETIKVGDQKNGDLTPGMKAILIDTSRKIEPALKQQFKAAVKPVYDYLKGKSKELNLSEVLSDTIASNNFLITVINDIDAVALVKEIIAEDDSQTLDGLSKELSDSVVNILTNLESQLKKELGDAVSPINDYLWGRSQDLSLAIVLGNSVLRPDFVDDVINQVDVAGLTKNYISAQLADAVSPDTTEIRKYINGSLDEITIRLEPWIKQQLVAAANPSVDYILGKSQTINVTISVAPAVTVVRDILKNSFLASPPPDIAALSAAEQAQHFDTLFADFSGNLPSTFSFDAKLLGPTRDDLSQSLADGEEQLSKIRTNIADGLGDANEPLAKARHYIGYFQWGYWLLIVFMVVMAGLIFLINRNIKVTTRSLGINLLIFGVLDLAGVIVAKLLTPTRFIHDTSDVPVSVLNIIDNVYKDVTNIALRFSIGVLVIGVILLTVSFIMKSRQTEELGQ
jgi:hypothetical protein